jgi:EF-hand domain pair
MSVSNVGSSNPYSYLQWPLQSDGTGSPDTSAPSDPLQSLFNAFTGQGSGDPLISALGSGGSDTSFSGGPQFSSDVMQALLSVQGDQSGTTSAPQESPLFAKFDADGNGQISQSEFEKAMGQGANQSTADALFNKIDANGDGSISQDEMKSAIQKAHGGGGHHHHHHVQQADQSQQSSDPLQALLSGAGADGTTSQSTTNSDGSTTTTISYTDGTKMEMTTPAASADGNANTDSNSANPNAFNFGALLKQFFALQAQLAAPTTNLSV